MIYFPSFLEARGVDRFSYKSKVVFIENQSVKYRPVIRLGPKINPFFKLRPKYIKRCFHSHRQDLRTYQERGGDPENSPAAFPLGEL